MGMDRNTIIGFVLIGLLMFGMFFFNSRNQQAFQAEQKRIADSIAKTKPKVDTVLAKLDAKKADSIRNAQKLVTPFAKAQDTAEKLTTIENEVMKIVFTNKGGQPKIIELKNYKTFDGKPVLIADGGFNKLSYAINIADNKAIQTSDIPFELVKSLTNADKSQTISYSLKDSSGGEAVAHNYTIKPDDYMIDLSVNLTGADKLITQNTVNLLWQTDSKQVEKAKAFEVQQSELGYVKNGDYDFTNMASSSDKKFDKPLDWISVKQQFFVNAIATKNKFSSADLAWLTPNDSTNIITKTTANCRISLPPGAANQSIPLQLYYGPSDYHILNKLGNQMEKIVPYGNGIFSFVKYINRHVLLPIWDFLRKNVPSYGMVILLLTLLIRLITSPILYKSYLSGAKMKALKPEIDALKAKHGEDKQAFSVDQMKLWKQAGVSPLGGCLPALLQIPIFMSLYYFFQANISLRGQSFLWAKDLASYDSIVNLPFNVPFYGDHVSLFTLTATLTSLLISLYSMSSMQDNSNPVMKYMPYIFPVLLLGVFNRLPAALTWYYTVSNTITLILQIVIQKYVINHDKIRMQIDENKKKPVKQSNWQAKVQQMQESQKKLQDLKNKTGKK
jgi:YidC/Oxa1 family membrane protein insertase